MEGLGLFIGQVLSVGIYLMHDSSECIQACGSVVGLGLLSGSVSLYCCTTDRGMTDCTVTHLGAVYRVIGSNLLS